jgi:hypothetical protein
MTTLTHTLVADTLSKTIDRVHEAFFEHRTLSRAGREEAARWIAARQGLPHAYAGTFALSDAERRAGIQVFTGERMTSASARHISGEEACVALLELDVADSVRDALGRATSGMLKVLHAHDTPGQRTGVYCCAKCCVSVWRNLAAGGLDHQDERLTRGLQYLRQHRGENGEWQRFPFAYTVFALTGIPLPEARQELCFVAKAIERKLVRKPTADGFARRRHAVYTRALEQI